MPPTSVYIDDRFVPAEAATVSVFDRGFLYGDALFETMRFYSGRPFLWGEHLRRLERGARTLAIRPPFTAESLLETALELLRRNALTDAVLRLTLSRGIGQRGYSPRGAERPTLVLAAFPAPSLDTHPARPWHLHTARLRLPPGDPLSPYKTANKLLHILARAEADSVGADESLLVNTSGHVAEASAANVFWWTPDLVYTPTLSTGALAGVTRGWALRTLPALGWPVEEVSAFPETLLAASGIFLTNGALGLVEVDRIDGQPVSRDPRLESLRSAYREAARIETGEPP